MVALGLAVILNTQCDAMCSSRTDRPWEQAMGWDEGERSSTQPKFIRPGAQENRAAPYSGVFECRAPGRQWRAQEGVWHEPRPMGLIGPDIVEK